MSIFCRCCWCCRRNIRTSSLLSNLPSLRSSTFCFLFIFQKIRRPDERFPFGAVFHSFVSPVEEKRYFKRRANNNAKEQERILTTILRIQVFNIFYVGIFCYFSYTSSESRRHSVENHGWCSQKIGDAWKKKREWRSIGQDIWLVTSSKRWHFCGPAIEFITLSNISASEKRFHYWRSLEETVEEKRKIPRISDYIALWKNKRSTWKQKKIKNDDEDNERRRKGEEFRREIMS